MVCWVLRENCRTETELASQQEALLPSYCPRGSSERFPQQEEACWGALRWAPHPVSGCLWQPPWEFPLCSVGARMGSERECEGLAEQKPATCLREREMGWSVKWDECDGALWEGFFPVTWEFFASISSGRMTKPIEKGKMNGLPCWGRLARASVVAAVGYHSLAVRVVVSPLLWWCLTLMGLLLWSSLSISFHWAVEMICWQHLQWLVVTASLVFGAFCAILEASVLTKASLVGILAFTHSAPVWGFQNTRLIMSVIWTLEPWCFPWSQSRFWES